jgi:hypothetical protein
VSSAEHFVRHHKRQTDHAISATFVRLAADEPARACFAELLQSVRLRAPRLLEAPVVDGRHHGIEALVNLAGFRDAHIRTIATWLGSDQSWRAVVNSLAQHLITKYRVPVFLAAAWYATDDVFGDSKREWFVAHSRGASFRSLNLPIRMTRRMEHVFLTSCDHFSIEYAMRRAELIGLGADVPLVNAVLAARPAVDLHHGDFWRTAWHFLVAHMGEIDGDQVAPLIDFLNTVRHEHIAIDTADGIVMRRPPLPDFSLKGRTLQSVTRLMEQWHRNVGLGEGGFSWQRSKIRPLIQETANDDPTVPPTIWELTELTNSGQLRAEGTALQHCVASYSYGCWKGRSRIWSLRRRRGLSYKSVVTVEINPARRTIIQARGFRNRRASGRPLSILQLWAAKEGLHIATP